LSSEVQPRGTCLASGNSWPRTRRRYTYKLRLVSHICLTLFLEVEKCY